MVFADGTSDSDSGRPGRRFVLVVDAANVVGARADGWWRDRAGAAARLRDRLAVLASVGVPADQVGLTSPGRWWPRVVLVTEGRARGIDAVPGVDVVEAPADGDDTVVSAVAESRQDRPDEPVVVVTADRLLRQRVAAYDAVLFGPAALWAVLDART
ncbi:NTP pyrophosphohydrolase [Saccharomonospora sp. NB11]|jgi:8-oxo-dGTP diphosphatase|uniref:NTP pyrophosphohydrolase n=1 Tax=Saccharomonospora sp. NB11 TaxID=1642298 RepID=UPI0018D07AD1|nr:NTP pyrophosphohydrolase [Saccharomonospora sp. NB11]